MSAPPVPVSRRAVAALYLERQWLDRPRGRRLTARTLEAFVAGACGLQIDSVNVVERAHHLTLWSRFGPYDRRRLERLIYRDRVLFEYFAHVACFVPTRDLAAHRRVMLDAPVRMGRRAWAARQRELFRQVERALATRGPLGSSDFERPPGTPGGGWWNRKPAVHALQYLWRTGRIAVSDRVHFQKRYAPIGRVLPQIEGLRPLPRREHRHWLLLRSLAAMGAATEEDLRMYVTIPRLPAGEYRRHLRDLLRAGRVVELEVEDEPRPWYARAEDLPALARAGRRRAGSRGTTLLSPFDSFLWHRARADRLWGYFYRIEIYVPGHRRTHGYYSLPVLHDGQLIGRVDVKTHRERGVLEARHAHFEPWFAAGEAPPRPHWGRVEQGAGLAGLAGALGSLAAFVGAERVALGRVTPAALRPALAAALAAAAGAPSLR